MASSSWTEQVPTHLLSELLNVVGHRREVIGGTRFNRCDRIQRALGAVWVRRVDKRELV